MPANRPDSRTPAAPRGFKKLLLYLIPFLITWFLMEVALTILDPILFKGFWQYDPDFGFRVRPGAMDSNSMGFNDSEHPLTKVPGTYRIMILGDSYNWVGGLKNYTHILQSLFDKEYGPNKVEVLNVGYPMTHTAEELGLFRKQGLQLKPDLLVLGFFCGNDFADGDPHRKRIVVNGTYFDIDSRHEHRLLGYPLLPQSRVIMSLKQIFKTWRSIDRSTTADKQASGFTPEVYNQIVGSHLSLFNTRMAGEGKLKENVDYILGALRDMAAVCEQNHIAFRVGILPAEEQVDPKVFNDAVVTQHLEAEEYDLAQADRWVQGTCDELHVPALDMRQAFANHTKNARLYIPRNTHWNEAGNTLAAELELAWLKPDVDRYFAQSKGNSAR